MVESGFDQYPGIMPPPPGETVDLLYPESIAYRLILVCILCPAITLIFCLIRMYTARFIVRKMYPDDWMIVASFPCAIIVSTMNIEETKNGICIHIWNVTPEQYVRFGLLGVPCVIFYNLSTFLTKASLLFFYLRFAAANLPFRITTYFVLFFVFGSTLSSALSFLYYCRPVEKLWDASVQGSCVDIYAAFLAGAAFNAAADVVILLLPIWLLWPLRVKLGQKIAVGLVLMAGGFVCCVSFIRLAAIPAGRLDPDLTWRICLNLIWCIIEMYMGIICACLPCLKIFVNHHLPAVLRDQAQPVVTRWLSLNISSCISDHVQTMTRTRATIEVEPAWKDNDSVLQSKGAVT